MVQPAFQADALQIDPSSGDTLTITRDLTTGSLRFVDAVLTAGINLTDLVSLKSITGLLLVGRAGSGAQYETIQSAVTAVPSNASATNPYTILVFPGVYTENVLVNKDGIAIVGIGQVSVVASAGTPTITITSGVLTTPLTTLLQGLHIETSTAGVECVLVQGGAGLTVGSGGIVLRGCNLAAKGVGSYTVRADIVNSVSLLDCTSDGSAVTAILAVSQCASFLASGGSLPATQADYSSAGSIPSVSGSAYVFDNCRTIGTFLSTLQGAGSLKIAGCITVGNVTQNGNRTGLIQTSTIGNLAIGNTSAVTLVGSKRGTVSGIGTLNEAISSGSTDFSASASEAVVFDVPRPDALYSVYLDPGVLALVAVTAKTAAGFAIGFGGVQTTTVNWTVVA